MSNASDRSALEFEMLRRFGAKWVVLTAMAADMAKRGIEVPGQIIEELKTARVKIGSGCLSACEINCELAKAEGHLFSQAPRLGEQDFEQWCNLLAEAMQGKLDSERVRGIPALDPVKNDCQFLGCSCSSSR
jgi:hypothetical protein